MPLVSAIVLFHNERAAREAVRCIGALKRQTIADQIEIVAVSNGASPALDTLFEKHTVTLIHTGKNIGYGAGNNAGARHAHGEFILIINPDNRLAPEALATMMNYLQVNRDAGLISPKLVFPDGTIRDSYRTFPALSDFIIKRTPLRSIFKKHMQRYLQWDQDPNVTRPVDWVCGACLLLRRSLYEELSGFDERYFLFLEDCDLCRRVWEKHLRVVYCAEAIAQDEKQRLSEGGIFSFITKRTVRAHIISAIKYFWKWRGKPLPRVRNS